MTAEKRRLEEARDRTQHWQRWGPYLSERQWGTVREDYSSFGSAWDYFPHDHARSRAYRWGEDGILGISDNHQRLCFAIALWNGQDPILKERIFGLTGTQGNHGEDVKDYYFYLDSTPTHSYMKGLYKYPQAEFPYSRLVHDNRYLGRRDPEFELVDTGVFEDNRYFDVQIEYAKAAADDLLIRIKVTNHGPAPAHLHVLPTLWFRNIWAWESGVGKPQLSVAKTAPGDGVHIIHAAHETLGDRWFYCPGSAELLFTDNDTNNERLFGVANQSQFVKDGINDYVVQGLKHRVNPEQVGTKMSPYFQITLQPGQTQSYRLRLSDTPDLDHPLGADFTEIFQQRIEEADEFYADVICTKHLNGADAVCDLNSKICLTQDLSNIQRQAIAGLLWTKQWYYYRIEEWLNGDPGGPVPPESRKRGRNYDWKHFHADDIISMPDKWEYPWFAAWDLAFHTVPLALVDPEFAKRQLDLMTREWYMHPNGQLPAYEWAFGDVNPPVHAWATWRVYKIEQKRNHGEGDRMFLERVFQKLLLNFTWWVNRKDEGENNVFEGGFLGLDNIGVFDRSSPLPTGGYIEQADGTSWMAMYCLNMLTISLELAQVNPVYEDMATKFFEHFLYIAKATNHIGDDETQLWDPEDGFFYDVLNFPNGSRLRLKVRSMVGLIPLFAVTTLEPKLIEKVPGFQERLEWFVANRPDLSQNVACMTTEGEQARRLLALVNLDPDPEGSDDPFRSILRKLLDEDEFLGEFGIRALSRFHARNPYTFEVNGQQYRVDYEPAESSSGLFGGNSNWRGPVWFPVNYLIIESLQQFHHYLGEDYKVECPTGSGQMMTLWEVAAEISRRLMKIFAQDEQGRRPVYGGTELFQSDPHWRDLVLFYEYFHGDNGAGIGASHQTGWTGLIAKLIQQSGESFTET